MDNTKPRRPSADRLRLDASALNSYLDRLFPANDPTLRGRIIEATPGRVVLLTPYADRQLRHGNVISGPTQMAMCDTAGFALVIAHVGELAMTVTTSLTIHFLRGALPGPITVEARLLKLGRKTATADVRLWSERPDRLASQATLTFFIPDAESQ